MKLRLLVGMVSIPLLAAVADAAPFAYVLNRGSGDVTVIDTAVYDSGNPSASLVRASLPVGVKPYSIAISPSGNYFVVANQGNPAGRSLKLVDVDSLGVIGSLDIDYVPGGMTISADGTRLYVADQTPSPAISHRVVVYTLNTNGSTPIEYIGYLTLKPLGATGVSITMPEGVAIDETNNLLFVANSAIDRISVFDLRKVNDDFMNGAFENPTSRLTDIQLAPDSRPTGLAVAAGRLYVANTTANTVQAFDTTSRTLVATYEAGSAPYNVTASPNGARVYAANAADPFDRILVIDTAAATSTLIGTTASNGTYACSAAEAESTPPRYLVTNVQTDELGTQATDVTLAQVGGSTGILIPAGVNPCSFGSFVGPKYDFTITTSATGGTITPSKTEGASANTVLAKAGTVKSFSFSGGTNCVSDVTVDGVSVGKPSTYTLGPITKNYTLNVTFGPCSGNTLEVNVTGTGFCAVSSSPAGISIVPPASSATATYAGGTVTLTATAVTGSTFVGWGGCTSSSGNTCTVDMSGNRSVTALCNLASLLDNEVLRGSTYYDTIAQAIADTGNAATVIKAVGVPTKAIQPITCTATQTVKLEGGYTSKQFAARESTLTPVGTVTIGGGCAIEFDGIMIQ